VFKTLKAVLRDANRRTAQFFYGSWPWGMAVAFVCLAALLTILGHQVMFGLGPLLDPILTIFFGFLLVFLSAALFDLILTLLTAPPRRLVVVFAGAAALIVGTLSAIHAALWQAVVFAAGFLMLQLVFGGAAKHLWLSRHKLLPLLLFLAVLAVNAGFVFWLAYPGPEGEPFPQWQMRAEPMEDVADPGQKGPYSTAGFTYGSGVTDRYREFASGASYITDPVDASRFLPKLSGWRQRLRALYWGFDQTSFPVNGRVWYPEGQGPFPLVLMVHGNHAMERDSSAGYDYLGEFLASRGYIFVSVDQNFLNGSWSGSIGRENDARAWMLLKHLQQWQAWTNSEEHRLADKVDMDNLALIGHSRGGEAAATAAAFNRLPYYPDNAAESFDFGFSIDTVVAIAPSDGQYKPANMLVPLENFNYLVLQGSLDSDVHLFMGQSPYQRLQFNDNTDYAKAAVFIHGANHGQFNTQWGRRDHLLPRGFVLNTRRIMEPELQRALAQTYIGAFLDACIHGEEQYLQLFRYPGTIEESGLGVQVITQYQDASWDVIADFSEGIDLSTTTRAGGEITAEGWTQWRQKNPRETSISAVDAQLAEFRWNTPEARFRMEFAEPIIVEEPESAVLAITAADARAPQENLQPLNFTIVLENDNGETMEMLLEEAGQMPLTKNRQLAKASFIESAFAGPYEVVPQTFLFDLNPAWEHEWRAVELRFDQSPQGKVWIERIGLLRKSW